MSNAIKSCRMGHLRAPVRKKAATGVAAFKLRRFNRLFFLAIRRIVDGQRLTEFAIEFVISQCASRRRWNHTKLAAAFGAKRERQFVFFFWNAQDDVEFGRLVGAQKTDRSEFALGVTIDAFEFFGYPMPMTMPPSIWPSTDWILTGVPTSKAETAFVILPFSSKTMTCVP